MSLYSGKEGKWEYLRRGCVHGHRRSDPGFLTHSRSGSLAAPLLLRLLGPWTGPHLGLLPGPRWKSASKRRKSSRWRLTPFLSVPSHRLTCLSFGTRRERTSTGGSVTGRTTRTRGLRLGQPPVSTPGGSPTDIRSKGRGYRVSRRGYGGRRDRGGGVNVPCRITPPDPLVPGTFYRSQFGPMYFFVISMISYNSPYQPPEPKRTGNYKLVVLFFPGRQPEYTGPSPVIIHDEQIPDYRRTVEIGCRM